MKQIRKQWLAFYQKALGGLLVMLGFSGCDNIGADMYGTPPVDYFTITVSDVLERRATDHERYAHIDIADWLIRWRTETIKKFGTTELIPLAVPPCPVPDLVPGQTEGLGQYDNPNFQQVATFFSPEAWPELSLLINDLDLIPRTLLPADPI